MSHVFGTMLNPSHCKDLFIRLKRLDPGYHHSPRRDGPHLDTVHALVHRIITATPLR
jgi:hypothetical protein